jgi:hypothetical protein
MRHRSLAHLVILAVAVVACDGADRKGYITAVEDGLTKAHGTQNYPQGQITIMSALSSRMESADSRTMRFRIEMLEALQVAEKAGFLKLSELQQSSLDQIGSIGARFFIVTPTDKLRQISDPKESSEKWLAVRIGTFKIMKVISDEPCSLKKATPGDEFRLVVGLVSQNPTQQGQSIAPAMNVGKLDVQSHKFRAILQFNPFNKSYSLVAADLGSPKETGWYSESVAQVMNGG